jgi:hypothetical protein
LKVQTANLLNSYRHERTAMANTLMSGLAADHHSRSVEVHAIRTSTAKMCEEFRLSRGRVRHSLRMSLWRSKKAVAASVSSLRGIFAKELVTVAKVRRHMARSQSAELAKDKRHRSHTTARMIKSLHVSHTHMAHELAQSLAEFTKGIKAEVSGLQAYGAPARSRGVAIHKALHANAIPDTHRSTAQLNPEAFKWPDSAPEKKHHDQPVKVVAAPHLDQRPGKPKKK